MSKEVMGPGSPTEQFIREMKKIEKTSEEEWSLKKKRYRMNDTSDWWYYEPEDIETLREKLIEDIDKWMEQHYIGFIDKDEEIYEIKEIINKRFGVE